MNDFVKKQLCEIIGVEVRGRMESLVRDIRSSCEDVVKDID